MKKNVICSIIAASMLVLTACGGNETETGNPSESAPVNQEQSGSDNQTQGAKGYVFASGSVTVGIDMDMAPIADALGEPASYFEAASCAFEGLDKTYNYGSYQITTYPQDDKDYVGAILFKDDMVATKEGISLFMTEQDMIDAYGEGSQVNGTTVYEKDGMRLVFIVEDGEITSIEYQSKVLDM